MTMWLLIAVILCANNVLVQSTEIYKYMVSVRYHGPTDQGNIHHHLCAGSILNAKAVLTTANCVYSYPVPRYLLSIQYGVTHASNDFYNSIVVHEAFIFEYYTLPAENRHLDDLAILQLQLPIDLSGNFAKAVTLPRQGEAVGSGWHAVSGGWSTEMVYGNQSHFLSSTEMKVQSISVCRRVYPDQVHIYDHLCAGSERATSECEYDGGGPLMYGSKQIGIVSWHIPNCVLPNHPAVYTNIATKVNWIQNILQNIP